MAQSVGEPLLGEERGARRRHGRRRWLLGVAAVVIASLIAVDLAHAPAEQRTTRLALAAITLYQAHLSPLLARAGVRCRFRPTCSVYGAEVVRREGLLRGGARAGWRLLRCGPWTPAGTEDPPYPADARPSQRRSREATK